MKRPLALLATALLAGCAQFTTSGDERSRLEAGATAAGDAYLACLTSEAGRYAGTTRDVRGATPLTAWRPPRASRETRRGRSRRGSRGTRARAPHDP